MDGTANQQAAPRPEQPPYIPSPSTAPWCWWTRKQFKIAIRPICSSIWWHRMRHALIEPLRNIYGVSDKVLNMTLADILLAAPASMPLWRETGSSMIAIDTLVHNFLSRTGITHRLGGEHTYGSACYSENGCADIVRRIARRIDARRFNPDYPRSFPRFVQHALWRWCAQSELNVCNGNNIDDGSRCRNGNCALFRRCDRAPLRGQSAEG